MMYIGPTNKIIYYQALAKKKQLFKKVEAASWKNCGSKINKDTPTSSVWNKIRKLQGKYVPQPLPSLVVNNSVVSDLKEVSDLLAEHFSKISSEESFGQDFRDLPMKENIPTFIHIILSIIIFLLL